MAIELYLMDLSPPCRAVVLTARYLGIDVKKNYVDLMKREHLKPEFLKINPTHTVPTIVDDGFCLWESRAIMAYLVNKYAPESELYPKDPKKRAIVDKMLYFDIGTLYKALHDAVSGILLKGEGWSLEKEKKIKDALHYLEEFLEKTPYVAGDKLTIADFSIITSLENIKVFIEEGIITLDFSTFPRIEGWMKRFEDQIPYHREIREAGLNQLKIMIKFLEEKKEASL